MPVPRVQVMVLMSGLLPDPKVSVSVMGLCIQTSGAFLRVARSVV